MGKQQSPDSPEEPGLVDLTKQLEVQIDCENLKNLILEFRKKAEYN